MNVRHEYGPLMSGVLQTRDVTIETNPLSRNVNDILLAGGKCVGLNAFWDIMEHRFIHNDTFSHLRGSSQVRKHTTTVSWKTTVFLQ